MPGAAKLFQVRHQILELLSQVARRYGSAVHLMPQVDGLIDELEQVWQTGDLEQLQVVREKAKVLAELAQTP
jgi:hypothetical protein